MPDDALRQQQIDALLAQATQGEDPEPPAQERFRSIRGYDFRHPSKFSKEQLRTLQMIFESFARLASTRLSVTLRSQVHLALASIQQAVFDEYARGLPATTLLNLVTADPLPGTLVFEYDLTTAFVLIDRLLGGAGEAPPGDREVTDIEELLLQSIAGVFLSALADAWAHIVPLQAQLQRLEYTPRFLQIASQNEPVVLLLFDLRLPTRQTALSLCIPFSVIEPIAAELNVQTHFAVAQRDGLGQQQGEADPRLQRVTVPIVALLGTTTLPLAEVGSLEVGDVIRLDGLAIDPLIVAVGQRPTFVARPGLARHGMAVQILGVLQEEVTR